MPPDHHRPHLNDLNVVVQFYPWLKFYFPLWCCMIMSLKQREIRFKSRIILNQNIQNNAFWFWPGFAIGFKGNGLISRFKVYENGRL